MTIRPLEPLEARLAALWRPHAWHDFTVLVAVSGGADSVALLRALVALKTAGAGQLLVAHFNHRLRGAESDTDQAFVLELCRQLEVECLTGCADLSDGAAQPDGLEAAAREARYKFLEKTALAHGARYIATAHTADDQAETVLHHVLRGTGLAGLAGISPVRLLNPAVTLFRPMLEIRRHEVIAYLKSLTQPFREDATNADTRFTRNRIRHELLPLAREYSAGVVEALLRLANVAGDAQRLIERAADELYERAVVESGSSQVTIDCRALADEDRHLVRELFVTIWRRRGWPLQAMGYAEWNLLADMALAGGRRADQSTGATGDSTGATGVSPVRTNTQSSTGKMPVPPGLNSIAKRVFPGTITVERRGDQLVLLAAAD